MVKYMSFSNLNWESPNPFSLHLKTPKHQDFTLFALWECEKHEGNNVYTGKFVCSWILETAKLFVLYFFIVRSICCTLCYISLRRENLLNTNQCYKKVDFEDTLYKICKKKLKVPLKTWIAPNYIIFLL